MKRVVLSALIIAFACFYSAASAHFAAAKSVEITSLTFRIEDSYGSYSRTQNQSDFNTALALSEKLEREAEKYENAVSLFVRDERLSTLEYSAARLKHLIASLSDEVSAELESVREQVETIAESEIPYWYNIL
ncbi:MAG: DUF4363 family protein [Ruminococcus sp.]|jgi:hypothetical protein|nr:DUF4363 family protein [Ruminococcus sp.]